MERMLHFENDYSSGAAPEILEALAQTNLEGNTGYGLDDHTSRAASLILQACGVGEGEVFFLVGGTQTNAVGLSWLCRAAEGVLCTPDAHINVHESGAIESCGLKVLSLPSADGKLNAESVERYMDEFYADPTWPHMVRPTAVYISQPTELGTLYSLSEMKGLREVCNRYGLALYLDGARLIYGLASPQNDVLLSDIAEVVDMFYIGGTKGGTLFGEALVIPGGTERERFFSHVKRHGALLAKGWLAGVQFERMFTNGLYSELGRRALEVATRLREGLLRLGYREVYSSATNQLFFELSDEAIAQLEGKATVDVQRRLTDRTRLVRFVTDWSNTSAEAVAMLALLTSEDII